MRAHSHAVYWQVSSVPSADWSIDEWFWNDEKHVISGLACFTIRWWNPATFAAMHPEGTAQRISWPYVENKLYLCTWLFVVPLIAYTLWQVLYFLIVNVLRRHRLLRDPEVMTSYRYLFSDFFLYQSVRSWKFVT